MINYMTHLCFSSHTLMAISISWGTPTKYGDVCQLQNCIDAMGRSMFFVCLTDCFVAFADFLQASQPTIPGPKIYG